MAGSISSPSKRLVVVADDFGRSSSVNRAIAEAHDRGIVTAASLMAGGEAFEEAVRLARERPRLSIGLHATFCDGRAILPPSRIPRIADGAGTLERSPACAGLRYAFDRRALAEIEKELRAQFDRAREAGVRLTHVDGHHHLHVHPMLFGILCRVAARAGVGWIRIPEGEFRTGRILEWAVFGILGAMNRRTASRHGLRAPRRVHGLAWTGRLDEARVLDLLPRVGEGWSELFAHPDTETALGRRELEALTSPRLIERIRQLEITLASYAGPAAGERW